MSDGSYEFQHLDQRVHNRAGFRCESEVLTTYIQKRARQDVVARVCTCFVAVPRKEHSRIAGYYTLSSLSIRLTELPTEVAKALPRYPQVPATLIGRLARDLEFRGTGLGPILMCDALLRSVEGAKEIASALVVVDPKDAPAADFYARFGFKHLDETRMFIPIKAAADWLRH